ncbi:uncharacterized protein LOC142986482 [Anticarsia gemmatalis]|uniref:uncharacterized protein LOC142986482 n=1 Tax=Anticarsia gemmatalis TaxID=129554 RepID=UPI003F75ADDD
MYTVHEGEIVFKEKYGSSFKNRLYVKPPEQTNIVIHEEDRVGDVVSLLKQIFLPQGYPDSVSKDYTSYQIWDTAQAFCSTITGTLATQEVLRGVGVGDTHATPFAATIVWVLKDACGHIGRILFAYSHGTYLDAYSKKWRLYADTLNDAAMCMELALPLFKNFTTPVLCISTVMKSIVGVAGGATRAAMTQHHAIRGNMADVAAKDSAQETAVNFVASIAALVVIGVFGNSVILFTLMMVLHIIFNYFAVRAVCLRVLNEPRFLQVIDGYLKEEVISTPCEINKNEPIVFYQMGSNLLDLKLCGFKILIGHSMKRVLKNQKAIYVKGVQEVYECRDYILFPDVSNRVLYVVLRDSVIVTDILCAYFHAVLLAIVTCAINDFSLAVYKHSKSVTRPFPQVCKMIEQADWSREPVEDVNSVFKYNPSIELMIYLDKIVQKEWMRIKTGLIQIGWDLSKHLLVVDEWRLCAAKIVTRSISVDDVMMLRDSADPVPRMPSRIIMFEDVKDILPSHIVEEKDTYTIEPESAEKSDQVQMDEYQFDLYQTEPTRSDQTQTNKYRPDQFETNKTRADQLKANKSQADRLQTNQPRIDILQTNKSASDQLQTNKSQSGQLQTNKSQADQLQSDKLQTDQPQADQLQTNKLQSDQLIINQSQADQRQTNKLQADQLITNQSQSDQPQADQPQTNQLQPDQPLSNQSQSDQPQTDKSQADQLQTNKLHPDQLLTNQPQSDQPQTGNAQIDQLQTNQSQVAQPQTSHSQSDQPQNHQSKQDNIPQIADTEKDSEIQQSQSADKDLLTSNAEK